MPATASVQLTVTEGDGNPLVTARGTHNLGTLLILIEEARGLLAIAVIHGAGEVSSHHERGAVLGRAEPQIGPQCLERADDGNRVHQVTVELSSRRI